MKPAKGGSTATNLPKGVLSENLVNEDREGPFDRQKLSEGCRFRKFGAIEPLRFQKMKTAKGGAKVPSFQGSLGKYLTDILWALSWGDQYRNPVLKQHKLTVPEV